MGQIIAANSMWCAITPRVCAASLAKASNWWKVPARHITRPPEQNKSSFIATVVRTEYARNAQGASEIIRDNNLIQKLIERILPSVARIGIDPNDSDDVRLQKSLLVLGSSMFIAAGTLWGILYFLFGQFVAGSIPLSYAVVSSLSVIVFHLTRRYRFFLFSQLLLILFLPFLLMIALGDRKSTRL